MRTAGTASQIAITTSGQRTTNEPIHPKIRPTLVDSAVVGRHDTPQRYTAHRCWNHGILQSSSVVVHEVKGALCSFARGIPLVP